MNIGELLKSGRLIWQNGSADMIGIDALLCHVLGIGKEDLIKNVDQEVLKEKGDEFLALVRRLYEGEPLSHLINTKEFYGIDFYVDKRVLTPRPETEQLVEIIEGLLKNDNTLRTILDIGTGSGCIAISLAKRNMELKIDAVDISIEALEVARMNAATNGVESRVSFFESDLLEKVKDQYDIIVTNLPYIGVESYGFVSKEVFAHEPHVALFAGSDGMVLYERLFKQIVERSEKPRYLLGEFGFLQGERMRELFETYFKGYKWHIFEDLASIERGFVVDFGKLK